MKDEHVEIYFEKKLKQGEEVNSKIEFLFFF